MPYLYDVQQLLHAWRRGNVRLHVLRSLSPMPVDRAQYRIESRLLEAVPGRADWYPGAIEAHGQRSRHQAVLILDVYVVQVSVRKR